MKVRHPLLIKTLGALGSVVLRVWLATLRFRVRCLGPEVRPRQCPPDKRYLYAFWHETLLVPGYFGRPGSYVLTSTHADGQLLTEVLRHLRFEPIAKSSREVVKAVRHLLRLKGQRHLVLTPDGPRGPRRQLQPGLVYLASRVGLPVVPVGLGFQAAWRARSWDRMVFPIPGSAVTCLLGEPITVPPDADRATLERYLGLVQAEMDRLTALAEEWAGRQGW